MSGVAVPDTCEKLSFWDSSSLASRLYWEDRICFWIAFGLPGLIMILDP